MNKKTIDQLNLQGRKVLLRVDFNVPMENGIVMDDNRINMAIPTIKKVIDEGGKLILFSHLGRVKEESDKAKLDLAPVAKKLSEKLGKEVTFIPETRGEQLESAINQMQDGDVLMFQNTRWEDADGNKESGNDPELGKYWASLGDVFINDAFGAVHRSHASIVGIASNIEESAIGYLIEKEVKALSKVLNPEKPFVVIMGGAKVSDKIGLINKFVEIADYVVAGGGMATTFTKALGHSIGESLLQEDYVPVAKELMEKYPEKIIVPLDFAVSEGFKNNPRRETEGRDIEDKDMAMDCGPKTNESLKEILKGAKTVIWNGPLGVTEFSEYEKGSAQLCEDIVNLTADNAYTVIGGGDSAAAAIKLGYGDKFTHISTGGGASMTLLEGKPLPGIDCIQNA